VVKFAFYSVFSFTERIKRKGIRKRGTTEENITTKNVIF